jgi:hypothetical protein
VGTGELAVNEEVVRRHHADLFSRGSSSPTSYQVETVVGAVHPHRGM